MALEDRHLARPDAREGVATASAMIDRIHPGAAELLVEAIPDDRDVTIWQLAVRNGDGELLWFHQDGYGNHPDTVAAGGSPEFDLAEEVVNEVENLLRIAYHQARIAIFLPAPRHAYRGTAGPTALAHRPPT